MPWTDYFSWHGCTYPELCWMFAKRPGPIRSKNGLIDGPFCSFLNSDLNINCKKKYIDYQNIKD